MVAEESPETLFISDLHLDESRPEMVALFLEFLNGPARDAAALYILGDLFEVWIGDDHETEVGEQVAAALRDLSQSGVPCFFMAGNRDFLLGPAYAARAGLEILADPSLADLYGETVLLMHGDSLCTDDQVHQAFRAQVREPEWQRAFLAKPVSERLAVARQVRGASEQHKSTAADAIMDVNRGTVERVMREAGVRRLIHGHTHRPAIHEFELNGTSATRIVLGDWYTSGSVLHYGREEFGLREFEAPSRIPR